MIKTIFADGKTEYEYLRGLAGRDQATGYDVETSVKQIIEDVRRDGDAAVVSYTKKFDGDAAASSDGGILVIDREGLKKAFEQTEGGVGLALLHAYENIVDYHKSQIVHGYEKKLDDGSVLGQTVRGLKRVGIYVPGGSAAYPSTVLMNAVPAKLAGVEEIVMVSPPRRTSSDLAESSDGYLSSYADINILAAAYIAGVDKVILAGGAQAVAALAYGTETFPKVDKIVGPGNVFVATAKRLLFGIVDIDMIAGPSEILIVADRSPRNELGSERAASFVSADLLSQAEHDPNAASILLTTDEILAKEVSEEIETQLSKLSRAAIARSSIESNGIIILCRSTDEMIAMANEIAPEHIELLLDDPLSFVPLIENAGSIFLGNYAPEPLGDYYSGTNHVLPTSGTARFSSPLGVYDFIKRTSYTYYTKEKLEAAKDDIMKIGNVEGLTAHVNSIKIRFE
ncbi:MAG: histidinol dehydrogenase [Clostridiales Family XIII bacterium]|jgi:histidinol dehydrogenase|nr:histidinol dehydrogenase [Clostridiales Family XIII bacterium]